MKKLLGITLMVAMLAGFGCAGAKSGGSSSAMNEAYAVSQTDDGKAMILYVSADIDPDKSEVLAKGGTMTAAKSGAKSLITVAYADGKKVQFLLDPGMESDVMKQYSGAKK